MDIRLVDGIEEILNTAAVVDGSAFGTAGVRGVSVQGVVTGSGSVSATLAIDVSNDGQNWLTVGTITLTGTASATDGFTIDARWAFIRARCTALSGTNKLAKVIIGV